VGESYDVVWAPHAIRDRDDILDYAASGRGADDAERFYLKIVPRISRLSQFLRRARIVSELRREGFANAASSSWRLIEFSSESLGRPSPLSVCSMDAET